ncbi:hypothetical protein PR048_027691 [Dryococelus australis]|uniref:Exportin-5 C-terminal domain-containing protein n=1 Tax=Dryococelus australis TaxID=614101 RepID=A0ABQ9GH85_9NEOP|nr:hypothetical protein PR048_027691 [Dryococelus australis]
MTCDIKAKTILADVSMGGSCLGVCWYTLVYKISCVFCCVQVLDCVLSRILMCSERPSLESGITLLEMCLRFEPTCPLLLSVLLSSISALFVFLSMAPPDTSTSLLRRVLAKIFGALVFTVPGQTREARSIAVKNVRRHAASLTVKIGIKYPLILLPLFDEIHATIQNISNDPNQLSNMERVALQVSFITSTVTKLLYLHCFTNVVIQS